MAQLTTSTISSNSVTTSLTSGTVISGGGIENITGTVTLITSTISGNSAAGQAGGLDNGDLAQLTASTISTNHAPTVGGIANGGFAAMVLTSTQALSNTATEGDGGRCVGLGGRWRARIRQCAIKNVWRP